MHLHRNELYIGQTHISSNTWALFCIAVTDVQHVLAATEITFQVHKETPQPTQAACLHRPDGTINQPF